MLRQEEGWVGTKTAQMQEHPGRLTKKATKMVQ